MTFVVADEHVDGAIAAIVDAARTGALHGRRHLLGLTGDPRHP